MYETHVTVGSVAHFPILEKLANELGFKVSVWQSLNTKTWAAARDETFFLTKHNKSYEEAIFEAGCLREKVKSELAGKVLRIKIESIHFDKKYYGDGEIQNSFGLEH